LVDLVTLLEDIAGTIARCPSVLAELDGNSDGVRAYVDVATTEKNAVSRTIYGAPSGSVLVTWNGTAVAMTQGEVQAWEHAVEIYVRARRLESPLKLLNAVVDGVPAGSSLPWRWDCVNVAVLPVQIAEIARTTDEEGIDLYVIRCSFREKGD
jgi:hypothetical protein